MKTIRLEEQGRFSLLSTDEPATSLKPDESLVRVRRIGVCGTDIHAFNGNQPFFSYPRILGHELGVGLVENARIDTASWITHRASFADVVAQFPRWTRPETGVIKAMIEV
jgi:threonine dehydrogenase-like Zn-dependent dehydrogenase